MATITCEGFQFTVLPDTASWSYSMRIQQFDTYDGRVVQLLACNVEGLSIEGYISPRAGDGIVDQWSGMEEFEWAVKYIMQKHETGARALKNGETPTASLRFDEVGLSGSSSDWSGQVYLTGYSDVRYEPDIPAVRYKLTFEVDSGFKGIADAASDQGLSNIPDGVNWVRNVYNTPDMSDESWGKLKTAIENIVDDAGTHDASNPADFYKYLDEAMSGTGDETEGATNADSDGSFTDKAQQAASNVKTTVLENLGLVKFGGSNGGKF